MRTLIIAEAGVNHNGDLEIAKQLIDAGAEAGVDYVKFQTFTTEKIVSVNAKMASYQKQNTRNTHESQFSMLKKLELNYLAHVELINYCNQKGVGFLSTAFDLDSIDLLAELQLHIWKIPSGEITNLPYLRKIASQDEPVIFSTGMATLGEIEHALTVFEKGGLCRSKITLLHCNTEYPTQMVDVNLSAMNTLCDAFKLKVGYSDHTLGIEIPIAAVALGAKVIEKHFTLDRNMKGPDHKASLEPSELKQMVESIRNVEVAMGNGIKVPGESEKKNMQVARKSIVAGCAIKQGETFTEDNLTVKRPGNGISPMRWDDIIGTVAAKDYKPDELI